MERAASGTTPAAKSNFICVHGRANATIAPHIDTSQSCSAHSDHRRRYQVAFYGTYNHQFTPSSISNAASRKIPWRMSAPQKLRQRRRLRRVDNVVSVLDTALKRQAASSVTLQSTSSPSVEQIKGATPEDLSVTAQGRHLLARHNSGNTSPDQQPFQGELPGETRKIIAEQARQQNTIKLIQRWKAEMPTEQEMLPKDKYTMFDRKARGYRKGVHKLPKWTRVSQRLNPPGF